MRSRHVLLATAPAALLLAGPLAAHGQSVPPVVPSLNWLDRYTTGDYTFDIAGYNFQGRLDHDGTHGWLLVGRGRQGWEFDADGPGGAIADVNQNLGTPAAFTPTAYSDTLINDLITDAGTDLTDVEIRLHRATNPDGTSPYQEARWLLDSQTTWTWDFDAGSGYAAAYEVDASILNSAFSDLTSNTRDTLSTPGSDSGNDATRVFTWLWANHGQQGFSYGSSVSNGSNSATSFLWENGNENHAIPYTEVYIRPISTASIPEPSTFLLAVLGLLGLGLLGRRRKR
jgi:uncharacterized protein (TIGR03382 family)